jgi:hypothetical protein
MKLKLLFFLGPVLEPVGVQTGARISLSKSRNLGLEIIKIFKHNSPITSHFFKSGLEKI